MDFLKLCSCIPIIMRTSPTRSSGVSTSQPPMHTLTSSVRFTREWCLSSTVVSRNGVPSCTPSRYLAMVDSHREANLSITIPNKKMYSGRRKQVGQLNTELQRASASFWEARIESKPALSRYLPCLALVSRSSRKMTMVLKHRQVSCMGLDGAFVFCWKLPLDVSGYACDVDCGLGRPSE